MNIIIESLENIRTTGAGTDIDSLKLFVAKGCKDTNFTVSLHNQDDSQIYSLVKISSAALNKTNYFGYRLVPVEAVPAGSNYHLYINNQQIEGDFIISDAIGHLSDEHDPVYVIGRRISAVNTEIIAQDAYSQQLTFYIKKKYDGVSFITPDKKIYFDYIPLDRADLEAAAVENDGIAPAFLSVEADIISEDVIPPNQQYGEWILLKWTLPYSATKKAGVVQFAISVVAKNDKERIYTWQTEPSSFKVSPNLAPRLGIVTVPDSPTTDEEETDEEINLLINRVDNIEEFLGYNTDDDPNNDQTLILGGGGAADYLGGEES